MFGKKKNSKIDDSVLLRVGLIAIMSENGFIEDRNLSDDRYSSYLNPTLGHPASGNNIPIIMVDCREGRVLFEDKVYTVKDAVLRLTGENGLLKTTMDGESFATMVEEARLLMVKNAGQDVFKAYDERAKKNRKEDWKAGGFAAVTVIAVMGISWILGAAAGKRSS